LANTGIGHFARRLQRIAVPWSSLTLLAVCGAVRGQEAQPPPEPDKATTAPRPDKAHAAPEPDKAHGAPEPDKAHAAPEPDKAHATPEPDKAHATPEPDKAAAPEASSTPASAPPDEAAKQSDQDAPKQSNQDVPYHWLDRTRETLYDTMWHSAEHVDRWFGSAEGDAVYRQAHGSIAPALLYTQYDGLRAQVRFNMNFPLPQINDRIHAFVGRFDPNEFITERDEPSGAIPRTYGPPTEDQTLLGIGYHQPDKQGSRFDAGTGIRLSFPLDPYIKGSYIFERGKSESGLFSVRETLFWQNSEGAGETTRLDLERIFEQQLLVRYTLSGTRSQKSEGLKGYSSILLLHGMADRRAVAFEVGIDGQSQAPVQLHDYGFKAAYRQAVLRRWLIGEVRTSVDWPKDFRWQHRHASLGIGVGCEMLLGTDAFLARPVTF
jgi:hypothetical protein